MGQVAADIEAKGGQAIIIAGRRQHMPRHGWRCRVIEKWGRIDVLLTAAGISAAARSTRSTRSRWDRTFAINVKGTYLWIHYAIRP